MSFLDYINTFEFNTYNGLKEPDFRECWDQSENLGGKLKNLYFVQSYAK